MTRTHSLRLARLCSTLLAAAAVATPAFAASGATTATGTICAVLTDNSGTRIEISNVGTAPTIFCRGRTDGGVCDEAFSVCIADPSRNKPVFAIGAQGTTAYNLVPFMAPDLHPTAIPHINPILDLVANPFNLCRPFVQTLVNDHGKLKPIVMFLAPVDPTADPLVYNLDDPDGDGMVEEDEAFLPGTLVQVAIDNKPVNGSCLGVRTAFQHFKGTCKLCKVRKFYNTCPSNRKIVAIREFERPCRCGIFSTGAGPRKFDTAVAIGNTFEFISLQSLDNRGVTPGAAGPWSRPSGAGSVATGNLFLEEFCKCPLIPRFRPDRINSCLLAGNGKDDDADQGIDNLEEIYRYLEVLLSYSPGGVTLKPGMEKLVTCCLEIQ